jgi:prevent-host-death family protein
MESVTRHITAVEFRDQFSDALNRVTFAGERIAVTRNGKLAAVIITVADLEALEAFEKAQDAAAYREARATDDGTRVSIDQLRASLAP